jgi:hypothetical protein
MHLLSGRTTKRRQRGTTRLFSRRLLLHALNSTSLSTPLFFRQCTACPLGSVAIKSQIYTTFQFPGGGGGGSSSSNVAWPSGWSSGCDHCDTKYVFTGKDNPTTMLCVLC